MTLRIVSWNVKGLGSPIKRQRVLSHLAKLKTQNALLQETHLIDLEVEKVTRNWVGSAFSSQGNGKRNGVIILFHKHLDIKVTSQSADSDGRWINLNLLINKIHFSIFNVYAPTQIDKNVWPHI